MTKTKDKPKNFQSPRGTHDILPQDQRLWEKVRDSIRTISTFYGFERIDTPHFESTDLFYAGVGRSTDIVSKQMYSFKTRGGDQLTLRPEGTAPVARAFVEHGMQNWPQPVKLYYLGSFFRHENPQRGRFRELNQWGLESLGDADPVADAQIMFLFSLFLREWDLKDHTVEVNSVGCPVCRPAYRAQLAQYYRSRVRGLCRDCKERFRDNPLRLLDCSEEKCQIVKKAAPQILDRLCEQCRNHLKTVLEFLEESSVPYVLNPHLVRGLDYYTRTVFETFVESAPKKEQPALTEAGGGGAMPSAETEETNAETEPRADGEHQKRLAIASGGRYDGLVELLGGKPTPAVGAALGLERFIMLVKGQKVRIPESARPKVFLVQLGELAKKKSFRLMEELRHSGIHASESLGRDSIRSQLKVADRVGAPYALILGQKEALDGMVILREMSSGIQETIPQTKLVDALRQKLRRPA